MKKTELAYLAGLFDGEGCITINKRDIGKRRRSIYYNLRISIKMVHKPVVARFKRFFGMGIFFREIPKNPRARVQWVWRATCSDAAAVLSKLFPYLQVKRPEAKIAFCFAQANARSTGKGVVRVPLSRLAVRENYYQRLHKQKGYEWKS